jgi:hypothetical protein
MRMAVIMRMMRRETRTPTNTEVCLEPFAADIVEVDGLAGDVSGAGLDGLEMPVVELASWTVAGDRLLAGVDLSEEVFDRADLGGADGLGWDVGGRWLDSRGGGGE